MSSTVSITPRAILVIATDTDASAVLVETVRAAAARGARVLVVAPALTTRLRHWTSDRTRAEGQARERLLALLDDLDRAGVAAEGTIGDPDPALAAADALAVFPADQMIVPASAPGFVRRLQDRYDGPILEFPPRPAVAARGENRGQVLHLDKSHRPVRTLLRSP